MNTQLEIHNITFPISQTLLQRIEQAASVLHRPLEDVLTATLSAALPDATDAPPHLQTEIMRMTWLSNTELWQIARRRLPKAQQDRLAKLSRLQEEHALSTDEQTMLEQLRQEYGRITVCKARAYAILSLRGGKLLLATA